MKERLDVLIVKKGLTDSREKAKRFILSGAVSVDGKQMKKPSNLVECDAEIQLRKEVFKYVSRGGYKLEKAIEYMGVSVEDKICLDIGASTGGFTDCMLQNGAKKVYAIDVGTNQLVSKLKEDKRVQSIEQTNIRHVTKHDIPEVADFASIDVSFISLTKVLLPVKNLLGITGEIVCLIKPQFEAGPDKVGKKGVVKDKKTHSHVIKNVIHFAYEIDLECKALEYSPIKGQDGNIEYLLCLRKSDSIHKKKLDERKILELVEKAHHNIN